MVRIDTQDARRRLASLAVQLAPAKLKTAQRMALNDAVRWGKTRISKDIRERYNIPLQRINDPERKKGLRITLATNTNADAKITGGHMPVNLATLTNTRMVTAEGALRSSPKNVLKRRNQGKRPTKKLFVSAEIIKGERKTIATAFVLGVTPGIKGAKATGAKAAIFARGRWGKPRFEFGKPRKPIAALHTVSVATAALHAKVQERWASPIKDRADARLAHHIRRLVEQSTR